MRTSTCVASAVATVPSPPLSSGRVAARPPSANGYRSRSSTWARRGPSGSRPIDHHLSPSLPAAGTPFARRAQILQALSHRVRVGILERLAATETAESPRALARDLGDALPTVAYHVR